MANLTPKTLYIGNDTASNVYTVSNTAGSYSIIRNIVICNTTSGAVTVSAHVLGGSGVVGSNNAILKSFGLTANETISFDARIVLDASYKLHVVNTSNNCTFCVTGVEYSA